MPVKEVYVNSGHCMHATTNVSLNVALSSASHNTALSDAIRINNTLRSVSLPICNEFRRNAQMPDESESLVNASVLCGSERVTDLCNIEHSYALLHAFKTLAISSVNLPTCDKNFNVVGVPTTQNSKNVQITVPSIRQHKVLDPTIAGFPIAEIEEPSNPTNNLEKHAARLIVIRRRKMKKHKLRKLRKRMKFVFEKIRNRREKRKETAFQAELLAQMKAAEDFDADKWAQDFLKRSRTYAKQRAEAEFWNSSEGGRLRYEIYLNTRKIPPDQR